MKFWLAVFCLLLPALAQAEDFTAQVQKIISSDEVQLSDGRTLRLSNIKGVEAEDYLTTHLLNQTITLQNPLIDRYGRIEATAFLHSEKQSIEDALLNEGLAFVYPATGDVDKELAEERRARQDNKGYWSTHPDTSADDAEKRYGSYGFVTGIVTKAERIKNKLYLNFGTDWRTDFTIAIAAHDLRAFKQQDLNPLDWQGKKIRVRGWIKRDFGPMITVTKSNC